MSYDFMIFSVTNLLRDSPSFKSIVSLPSSSNSHQFSWQNLILTVSFLTVKALGDALESIHLSGSNRKFKKQTG